MDRNHDGVVTIDEFLDCCRCDQAITNSMLVFDSTIWPSGHDEDGNRRNLQSSLSSQKASRDDQRVPHNEHNRQHQRGAISTKSNGNGSTKSDDNHQGHKNLSSSFGESSREGNGHAQHQPYHPLQPPTTVFGNKTKNNVGHKASQTKRIQLSTAAKRCKSINRSNAVDNNNSKTINLDDICKADDVEDGKDDDNCVAVVNTPNQRHNIDIETIANNSISTQSMESPTLVKVKTWYTETTVALPTNESEVFWYWTFLLHVSSAVAVRSFTDIDKEVKFRQFYDLWRSLSSPPTSLNPPLKRGGNFSFFPFKARCCYREIASINIKC